MSRILIRQHDLTDCGPACLAAVARHYRLNVPVARIRQLAGTDSKGTNITGLLTAAQKMGFDAKGVKGELDSLQHLPLPAIAHLYTKTQWQHYVVVSKVKGKKIHLMDPAHGKIIKKTSAEFVTEWTGVLVILFPNTDFESGSKSAGIVSRFIELLKPHRLVILQAIFGAIIYTLLGLLTAVYAQKVIDFVLIDGNRGLLNFMGIAMVMITLLKTFIGTVKSFFIVRTGQLIDAQLILGYYKHLLKLPLQFFESMRIGEITSRFNDAIKIRRFLNDAAINIVLNVLIVCFSFILMFSYYWKIGLLMLLIVPIYMVIYITTNSFYKKINRKLMEQAADLESQFVESISTIGTVKRFNMGEFILQKTENKFIKLLGTIYQTEKISLTAQSTIDISSSLLTVAVLWLGAGYALDREITPGELFSFYALIGYFTGPAAALIGASKIVQEAVIAADRLFEIMDLELVQDDQGITLQAPQVNDIEFRQVTFGYGSRSKVFDDLNFKIKIGQMTAFVGESGSGKSTIIGLLQKIYPIQRGNIFIGKYAIDHISAISLRNLIAVVPQEIELFAGTITENIAIGDEDPDLKRIVDICTDLGLISFIHSLPFGFQTDIGENGATLSGGQKQKIAIARALYRNPEILILDEATSLLDPIAEEFVKRTIANLIEQRKTIIVIAHRLATIVDADHIIVVKKGKILEEGTHQALINGHQFYYRLWQMQSGSYLKL